MHRPLLQPAPPLRVYSPFGVVQEGRTYTSESGYRYGFQAQEEDAELWEGLVNYKYRVEDPRLGRFFSVDPLTMKYSFNSPYAFSENRVIDARELEGLESAFTNKLEFGLNTSIKCHTFNDVCKENKYVTLGVCGIALVGVAVSIYGVATVGTYVLKEGGEMVFEELTGIPVILDPLDMLEALTKQGAKTIAKDVIMHGRTFLQGSPVEIMNHFAYNVKIYGQKLADLCFDGKISIKQAETLLANGFDDLQSNGVIRQWYDSKVKSININIVANETNARAVVAQRNLLKKQARDMMADREKAASLDITDPIMDYEQYFKKYGGDYKKIIEGGSRPNGDVSKQFGIE